MMEQYVFPFNDVDNIELLTSNSKSRFGTFSAAGLIYFDPRCVSDSYNSDTDRNVGVYVSISNKLGSNYLNYCELNDLPILLNASDLKLFIRVISQNIRSLNKNVDEFFHDVEGFNSAKHGNQMMLLSFKNLWHMFQNILRILRTNVYCKLEYDRVRIYNIV